MANAIEIFVSYERKDEDLRKELENQLSPLQSKGLINLWHPGLITPGKESAVELQTHLKKADIFLLLITANYISSKNYALEMNFAMKQQRAGKAQVIPILLSPVYWEDEDYGDLKPLPDNGLPVSSWRNRAEAFFNIAAGIRRVVKELNDTTIKVPPSSDLTSEIATKVRDPLDRGNKEVPGETTNPASQSPLASSEKQRLLMRQKTLLKRLNDLTEKLEFFYNELKKIGHAPSEYELRERIKEMEAERDKIEEQLNTIEQQLI